MDYQSSIDDSDYEVCQLRSNSCGLPFDPTSIESIILTICDNFDLKVILSDTRAKGALLMTTGLTIAGGLIGRHYGGKVGAMVGGAVGGACGLGIIAISMREIWQDVKEKLSELFDIVYDYLAGMGMDDYYKAAMYLANHSGTASQLAMVILETASSILGKKIISKLTVA